jgi:hypothetical protein
LVKQIDFWKPKSHISTTWAFYVTYKDWSLPLKITQVEQLKCVICYPIVPLARQKNTSLIINQ